MWDCSEATYPTVHSISIVCKLYTLGNYRRTRCRSYRKNFSLHSNSIYNSLIAILDQTKWHDLIIPGDPYFPNQSNEGWIEEDLEEDLEDIPEEDP